MNLNDLILLLIFLNFSFRIIVKKKKQDELNKYGPIRPLDDLSKNKKIYFIIIKN